MPDLKRNIKNTKPYCNFEFENYIHAFHETEELFDLYFFTKLLD
jgi:hypothetical protein